MEGWRKMVKNEYAVIFYDRDIKLNVACLCIARSIKEALDEGAKLFKDGDSITLSGVIKLKQANANAEIGISKQQIFGSVEINF